MKRILFIAAHPDDETFFAAGTFAKYREAGVEVHVLCATRGDSDKKLAEAPPDEMRAHLVGAMRRIRPDITITFDPHGANQHPDHIAISRFVSDSVPIAADSRWFPETGSPFELPRLLWTPPTILFRLPADADPRQLPGFDFIIDVERWKSEKTRAFEAHRTQFPGLKKLFFDDPNGQRTFGIEAFRFARGRRPALVPADDLFAP